LFMMEEIQQYTDKSSSPKSTPQNLSPDTRGRAPSSGGLPSVVASTTALASSLFGGITTFFSSLEWDDPTKRTDGAQPPVYTFPKDAVVVARRAKYLLQGEEVTMKFQYVEGKPSEMKIELFSIEHGAYGTLFENINMEDIVAQLPKATLSLKDEKVILEVGPHGLLPIVLDKYILAQEVRSQIYEEEIRRLNSNYNILSEKYNSLLARVEKLEDK